MSDKNDAERRLPILCCDFDGVIHSYDSGWKGAATITDEPVPGALDFLDMALDHFNVQIFSSRSNQPGGISAMQLWLRLQVRNLAGSDVEWLAKTLARFDRIKFPTEKPAAFVTIDDRAITFDGTWPSIETLKAFKPWNKK